MESGLIREGEEWGREMTAPNKAERAALGETKGEMKKGKYKDEKK